jgi:hypothetical protein
LAGGAEEANLAVVTVVDHVWALVRLVKYEFGASADDTHTVQWLSCS